MRALLPRLPFFFFRKPTFLSFRPLALRSLSALLSAAAAGAALALAQAHPWVPQLLLFLVVLWMGAVAWRPALWLIGLPALLPVAGLASWTGWITFEEFDVAVLAAAAGGYGRIAFSGLGEGTLRRMSRLALCLLLAALVSLVVAVVRGIDDAGGFAFGWYQGYGGPMNSVRLAKSFLFAILMLPLFRVEWRRSTEATTIALMRGMTGGLLVAALVAVWERAAFTDLLNFSADYRTTALFWEMHVGGAALDGFLALTVPAVGWWLARARTPRAALLPGVLVAVAAYTCLTTFSRGVYAAEFVSVLLLVMLLTRASGGGDVRSLPWGRALLLVAGTVIGGYGLFRYGGYRGLLAGLMVLATAMPLAPRGVEKSIWVWLLALGAGSVLSVAGAMVAWRLPKGPYLLFTLIFVVLVGLLWRSRARPLLAAGEGVLVRTLFVWLAGSAASLAGYWGGGWALEDAVIVMAALVVLVVVGQSRRWAPWAAEWRGQAVGLGMAAILALFVAIFSGGAYMGERFATSNKDFGSRLSHWQQGLALLRTDADWWLGKGFGRFPESYYFALDPKEYPGRFEWRQEDGNGFISMTGPHYFELLNLSQRVAMHPGEKLVLEMDVRSAARSNLEAGVCEKHLLYLGGCAQAIVKVPESPQWTHVTQALDGKSVRGGPWYAPRMQFFYVAVVINGGRVEIDNLRLTGADGRQLLANGDFLDQTARWFFTSDHHHMPWHIKSLFLNVMFDQGVLGLTLFLLMGLAALYRLTLGKAAALPIAPYLAAALVAFYVVGMFDSLTDVPRLAFLYHFLVLIGLTCRAPRRQIPDTVASHPASP